MHLSLSHIQDQNAFEVQNLTLTIEGRVIAARTSPEYISVHDGKGT